MDPSQPLPSTTPPGRLFGLKATLLLVVVCGVGCFPSPSRPGDKGSADTGAREDSGDTDPPSEDLDGDGVTTLAGDCDDGDATVYPGAADPCGDGKDADCSQSCRLVGELSVEDGAHSLGFYDDVVDEWGTVHSMGDLDQDGYAEVGVSTAGADCSSAYTVYAFDGPFSVGEVIDDSAWSASWSTLPDRWVCGFAVGDGGVAMTVDVGWHAVSGMGRLLVWPLDPTDWSHSAEEAAATSVIEAEAPSGSFGMRAHFTEDLDGDGIADLLLPDASITVEEVAGVGALHVLSGGELQGGMTGTISEAGTTYVGTDFLDYFGMAADAADLNDDGYPELIVGAEAGGLYRLGALFLFSPEGALSDTPSSSADETWSLPDSLLEPVSFGLTVRAAELSGDSETDVVVGAPAWPDDDVASGAVFLLPGPFEGGSHEIDLDTQLLMEGAADFDHLGWTLDVGDFDGDSRTDLLSAWSAAWSTDSGSTPTAFITYNPVGGAVDTQVTAPVGHSRFAYTAAFAGDLSGDGTNDLLIGDSWDGRAWAVLGQGE